MGSRLLNALDDEFGQTSVSLVSTDTLEPIYEQLFSGHEKILANMHRVDLEVATLECRTTLSTVINVIKQLDTAGASDEESSSLAVYLTPWMS